MPTTPTDSLLEEDAPMRPVRPPSAAIRASVERAMRAAPPRAHAMHPPIGPRPDPEVP